MKYLALQLPGVDNGSVKIIPPGGVPSGGASGPHALSSIIAAGLDLAVVTAIIICLFVLILGGFNWITSEGDKQKVASARQRLAFAVIGLIIVFTSFLIINVIYTFFFGTAVDFLGSVH
jgi:hypothetical protein